MIETVTRSAYAQVSTTAEEKKGRRKFSVVLD